MNYKKIKKIKKKGIKKGTRALKYRTYILINIKPNYYSFFTYIGLFKYINRLIYKYINWTKKRNYFFF